MRTLFIIAAIAPLLIFRYANAEIAVRHPTTSEVEFQALAQALGYTTVAELLTEKNVLSHEVSELYRIRLIEAQTEWLKKRESSSLPAIDRFLELALEADWPASERQAFVIFFIRRLESKLGVKEEQSLMAQFNAFILDASGVNLSSMSPRLRDKWNAFLKLEKNVNGRTSLPSGLPCDVVGVFLNGRATSRQNLAALLLTPAARRVTLISNTYQPVTVRLSGTENDWPMLSRQPWINEDCSINIPMQSYGDVKLKALGFAKCAGGASAVASETSPELTDEARAANSLSMFGLSRNASDSTEFPRESAPSVLKRPWVWGALGVLAVGVVLAVRANDKSAAPSVQATTSEGW